MIRTYDMKIFISHSQDDENLALILKNILEKDEKITRVFMFEKIKKYGIQIEKKITDEIIQSDYVIAIITKDSIASASVNQEIGYAQAKNIERIPLIEKDAKEGFLVYGTEKILFTTDTFEDSCKEVRDYIIQKGRRKKDEDTFTPQELLVQKNAHFRYELESSIHTLLHDFTYRLDIIPDNYHKLSSSSDIDERIQSLQSLKTFMKNKQDIIKQTLMDKYFMELRKLGRDYNHFIRSVETMQQFSHDDLLPDECDLFVRLKRKMLEYEDHKFDPRQYIVNFIEDYGLKDYNTYGEILENLKGIDKEDLERELVFYMEDLSEFMTIIIQLQEEFENVRQKYGDLAFKTTY